MWLTARITPPVRGTFSRPRQSRFVNSRSSGLSTTTTSRYQKPSFPRRTRDLRSSRRPSRRLPAWIDCPGSTAGSAGDEPRSLRSLAGAPDSCRATPAGQDRVVRWVLVVPVKRLLVAKSRLAPLAGPLRTDLARAMALDTVAAALTCPAVEAVLVVTDEPGVAREAWDLGARVVPDSPNAGLNPALEHAALIARARWPGRAVAALSADLPALRPDDLARALDAATAHPRAFLPDASGTGTTLLCARVGQPLAPAFGAASRDGHRRGGAVELRLRGVESVARDVDTPDDLAAAARLGIGARTRAVITRLGTPVG